ncbi:hypothetical protein [Halobacillus mangrovi]|uniref:Flavoprotein n=1 Tax=Halobacillus mangrovi TaxID=402384 RepID=A0A1W6A0G2_9BACI|nr:hypothetical protein [Halobacillus mangrovi]ARI79000.1 hypothetical protein HM131_20175 [Halobacillus mangrovi]
MEFHSFYETFKEGARKHDLGFLKETISDQLVAREIRQDEVIDYSYEDSIEGWKQAFEYFQDKDMIWIYTDHSLTELKENEWLASFWVSIELEGELLDSSNLFFNTYKQEKGTWQLVRTYIEAGVQTPESVKVTIR